MLEEADGVLSNSLPTQVEEFLSKIREHGQELISNAEKEATAIINEAKQRTEDMNKEIADWEEEKKRIASTHALTSMVTLNVGGKIFTTATATLTRFPDTMLGAMFSGRHALKPDKNGAYCIDRDGRHFQEILNFLRGSEASTLERIEQRLLPEALEELHIEADYYGVKHYMFPMATAVQITGAKGSNSAAVKNAGLVNGMYAAMVGSSGVYSKNGDDGTLLEYYAGTKQWQVKETADRGTDKCVAYCAVPAKCSPELCPKGQWQLWEGVEWKPTITIEVANGN